MWEASQYSKTSFNAEVYTTPFSAAIVLPVDAFCRQMTVSMGSVEYHYLGHSPKSGRKSRTLTQCNAEIHTTVPYQFADAIGGELDRYIGMQGYTISHIISVRMERWNNR